VSRIIIFGKEVLELADFALPLCGIDMNRGVLGVGSTFGFRKV